MFGKSNSEGLSKSEREFLDNYKSKIQEEKMKFKEDPVIVELAGAKFYLDKKQKFLFKKGDQMLLFSEPANPLDENAIKVVNLKNQQVGYITREYEKQFGLDIKNGYFFEVIIDHIENDLLHPHVMLKVSKLTELADLLETSLESQSTDNKEINGKSLCEEGLVFENHGEIEKAIHRFEKAITFSDSPSLAYKRLIIHYHKVKDFESEIRVLTSWLPKYSNLSDSEAVRKAKEIEHRIEKTKQLKNQGLWS